MTDKQKHQFNKMLLTLKRISKDYQTVDQLRRDSESQYGLGFEETIEMAYENIQNDAKNASKNVRVIK